MTQTGSRLTLLTILSFGMLAASSYLAGPSGCGGSTTRAGTGETGTGGIVDETGAALTSVDTSDPVNLSLSGLTANTQYNISVTNPSGVSLSPSGGFVATTDEDGNLPSSTVVQDLSTTTETASLLMSGAVVPRIKAQTGTYTVSVTNADGTEVFNATFTVADNSKVYCTDASGTARASFTTSQTVYARIDKGEGSLADGTYRVYVISDRNAQLADQDTLTGTSFNVTVASGTVTANLGNYVVGPYDVVVDLDNDGLFDRGSDLISRAGRFRPCFTIQDANSGSDIIGQVCSDRNGNYRDIFDPNATDAAIRDVFAWISPSEQSLVTHAIGVRKYVVAHKSTWTDGDTLTDVDANEVDAVQGFCTNEAPWLVWPRQNLVAGCYDCIIDVNMNGVYDKGTDFLDNIDNTGDNAVGGMCVSDTACEIITISAPADGATVTDTTATLTGSSSDATVTDGRVTVTSGSSSNTFNLTVDSSGAFTGQIPLFNGENIITVRVTKTNGVVCAKTIRVTSSAASSSNELIRAQAAWDADTDIDLHLVKPSGAYLNQGGDGDGTDCNYANCKTEDNSVDWGVVGDDDDPQLDVDDCVGGSCLNNHVENIILNQIPENGDFKVYLDAFANEGGPAIVTATIFIRGASVGSVTCTAMQQGTGTDSCFVGTISWSGGTGGNGTFSPDGTQAADF